MKEMTYEQALCKAASLCSCAEHCSHEIKEKLIKWGLSPAQVSKAIDYLIDEKYIDNSRFARAYCLDKSRYNRWGRIKIRQMLRMMELTDAEIQEGLSAIESSEYIHILREVALQKERTLKEEDEYTRRGKLIRHLLSRGFEMDIVMKELGG